MLTSPTPTRPEEDQVSMMEEEEKSADNGGGIDDIDSGTQSKIDLNTLKNADQIKEAFLQLSKEEVNNPGNGSSWLVCSLVLNLFCF